MTVEGRRPDGTSVAMTAPGLGPATRAGSDGGTLVIDAFDSAIRHADTAPFCGMPSVPTQIFARTSPAGPPPLRSDFKNEKLVAAGAPVPR